MASGAERLSGFQESELSSELAGRWRRLTRAATGVPLITAPWSWLPS